MNEAVVMWIGRAKIPGKSCWLVIIFLISWWRGEIAKENCHHRSAGISVSRDSNLPLFAFRGHSAVLYKICSISLDSIQLVMLAAAAGANLE